MAKAKKREKWGTRCAYSSARGGPMGRGQQQLGKFKPKCLASGDTIPPAWWKTNYGITLASI